MKILAAVVTHNRRELLGRCIDQLLKQVRAPDELLIINNSSTDGTEDMLRARGVPYITQENTGSAGGWRRGIEHAIEQNFDAVWLMDDDGFPDTGALAILEKALTPGVACASSIILREDRPTHFVFPMPFLDNSGQPVIFGAPRKIDTLEKLRRLAPDGIYPFAHLFNGALISADAARAIGNVNQNYFISGDEVDYFCRLRKGGRVVSLLDAIQFHPDVSKRPFTPVKFYYYLKNTLILNERYFDAVPLRNLLAVAAVLGRTAKRNGPVVALSYLFGRNAPVFYQAIIRGLRGQIGKDFDG
jgi:rhamnopyranosyl-N-acetylglucosaminyl-diphospho-decaprenol beta-1,3/1,4-galactofuranosyltransferase